jgi:hypothetical protein
VTARLGSLHWGGHRRGSDPAISSSAHHFSLFGGFPSSEGNRSFVGKIGYNPASETEL